MNHDMAKEWLKSASADLETIQEIINIDTRYPGDFGLLPDGKPSSKRAIIFYDFAKITFEEISIIITKR